MFDASLISLEKQKKISLLEREMNVHCSYDLCLPNIVNTTKEKDQNKYVTKKERKKNDQKAISVSCSKLRNSVHYVLTKKVLLRLVSQAKL